MNDKRLDRISDDDLLRRLAELLRKSRRVESELVAHIAEVDARRLYARHASSMFTYAVERLHLSEAEAYLRISVARASRKYPVLLDMLADGRLHLSGIALLAGHLTDDNRDAVLARAAHKTKREIEELVAELAPRPDVPSTIRKQPVRRAVAKAEPTPVPTHELCPDRVPPVEAHPVPAPSPSPWPAQEPRPAVQPLAPERYKVTFTADAALRDKLRRLEALMQSDLADAIDAAVTEKLERLEASRYAKTRTPKTAVEDTDTGTTRSRYIAAAVKRAVCVRDGDQCTFVDEDGRRCTERDRLEFHHDDPFGKGGGHSVENIRLLCKTHNLYLAERDYGRDLIESFRRSSSNGRVSEPMPIYSVRTELADESLTIGTRLPTRKMRLRKLIFGTAKATDGVGELEETLQAIAPDCCPLLLLRRVTDYVQVVASCASLGGDFLTNDFRHVTDVHSIGIEAVHDTPRNVLILNPKLVTPSSDTRHGSFP